MRRPNSYQGSLNATSVTVVDPDSFPNSPQTPEFATHADVAGSTKQLKPRISKSNNASEPPLPEDPIQGWPSLALMMAKTPDCAAFPRFRDLNVKSLLYYQAQLTNMRRKLHEIEYSDYRNGKIWAERADKLVENTNEDQFKLVKEMREILKEYNDALLQFSQVCSLPNPEPFNMNTLRKWLRNRYGADNKVRGSNNLANTWGTKTPDERNLWKWSAKLAWHLFWGPPEPEEDLDLAATTSETKVDGFTRWVAAEFTPFKRAFCRYWQNKWNGEKNDLEQMEAEIPPEEVKKKETLVSWSEKGALRITSTISTVIACLLPVIAISILSQLHGLRNLLGCLAGFAALFSMVLIFLTQGTSSRTEIFAATAAFSAVMVVFISQPPAPVVMVAPGSTLPSISPSPTPSS